jgi:hypothetical protein
MSEDHTNKALYTGNAKTLQQLGAGIHCIPQDSLKTKRERSSGLEDS